MAVLSLLLCLESFASFKKKEEQTGSPHPKLGIAICERAMGQQKQETEACHSLIGNHILHSSNKQILQFAL